MSQGPICPPPCPGLSHSPFALECVQHSEKKLGGGDAQAPLDALIAQANLSILPYSPSTETQYGDLKNNSRISFRQGKIKGKNKQKSSLTL